MLSLKKESKVALIDFQLLPPLENKPICCLRSMKEILSFVNSSFYEIKTKKGYFNCDSEIR